MTALKDNLDEYNPIYMMADSGARGSMNQIRQLAGMRGLDRQHLRDGRSKLPSVQTTARVLTFSNTSSLPAAPVRDLADTALRTADSGYLTRRLVDVSQDVIIREDDCGTHRSVSRSMTSRKASTFIEPLSERLDRPISRARISVDKRPAKLLVDNDTHDDRRGCRQNRQGRNRKGQDPFGAQLPAPSTASAKSATAPTLPTASRLPSARPSVSSPPSRSASPVPS